MLGTHDVSTADTVTSFANNYYLPYVTSSPTSELTQKDYVISLRPDVTRAVVDILSFYRWREVYYIYDDKRGNLQPRQFYKSKNQKGTAQQKKIEIYSTEFYSKTSQ